MRIALAVIISLTLCLLAAGCLAQSTSSFQSVSGESARGYLSSILADKPAPAEAESKNNSSGLWDWGGAPRGSKIVGGKLVTDTVYNLTRANAANNWLGDVYVDPYTGNSLYAYVDPNTGKPVYYYIDPKTGNPVYTDVDPATGEPAYTGLSPYASSEGSNGLVLPPVFSTNDPWA